MSLKMFLLRILCIEELKPDYEIVSKNVDALWINMRFQSE